MARVLVCGDRNWKNAQEIEEILASFGAGTVVIEGMAPGADTMAGRAARRLGYELLEYPARWGIYGRAAGPKRNQQMLDEGKPERVYAFHNDIASSKGTRDMIARALKAKLPVVLVHKSGGAQVSWISKTGIGLQ